MLFSVKFKPILRLTALQNGDKRARVSDDMSWSDRDCNWNFYSAKKNSIFICGGVDMIYCPGGRRALCQCDRLICNDYSPTNVKKKLFYYISGLSTSNLEMCELCSFFFLQKDFRGCEIRWRFFSNVSRFKLGRQCKAQFSHHCHFGDLGKVCFGNINRDKMSEGRSEFC